MGFFDEIETELLESQEATQESLNLKKTESKKEPKPKKKAPQKKHVKKQTPKKKVDLHVTIPEDLKKKLEAKALKEHRSVAVMLELILEQGLNKS